MKDTPSAIRVTFIDGHYIALELGPVRWNNLVNDLRRYAQREFGEEEKNWRMMPTQELPGVYVNQVLPDGSYGSSISISDKLDGKWLGWVGEFNVIPLADA